tara:strand:+ start:416 stop:865 length:450 start_codon:yes stop_codon:yes gene_type:complete
MKFIRYQQPDIHSSLGNFSSLFEDALTRLAPLGRSSEQTHQSPRSQRLSYKDNEAGFDFIFEVPGTSREDVNLQVEKNVLTVSTENPGADNIHGEDNERTGGGKVRYQSQVRLPRHLDLEGAKAPLENGILTVSFPKAAQAKARQIEIT